MNKIQQLLEQLNKGLYEKEHVMALALLSAVAGESLFLLGPPGIAKSMIARRLKAVFTDGTFFEYLMSRFSTPDELFGPVSISRLKDEDRYERQTSGYLPSATVVFLDELWKAGPAIQNTLLTVLNERLFHNGNQVMRLPLQVLIAASNELPAADEGLDALWDRFLVRCLVTGISRPDLFNRMVSDTGKDNEPDITPAMQLTTEETARWRNGAAQVEIPAAIFSFLHKIRTLLLTPPKTIDGRQQEPLYVSDRRWKKAVGLLRTSAFLNGRSTLSVADLPLLEHCLWDTPERMQEVQTNIAKALEGSIEEDVNLSVVTERIETMREELRAQSALAQSAQTHLKTVQNFFYQLETSALGKPLLIYTNEYARLDPAVPQPFILVTDKRRNNAQVLKLYERSRYPNVFPKDILQLTRAENAVTVNGIAYPLVTEKAEVSSSVSGTVTTIDNTLLQRFKNEIDEVCRSIERRMDTDGEAVRHHLFLDDRQKKMVENAFRTVQTAVERQRGLLNELIYSYETAR